MHTCVRMVSCLSSLWTFVEIPARPLTVRCTVLPEGPSAIKGQELAGDYYEKAGPVVELQIARGGYRLAAWLDKIAETYRQKVAGDLMDDL